jgi:FkbM family methyltransferase
MTPPPGSRRVQTRHGAFHILAADTIVGRSLDLYGEWTEPEIALLVGLLQPGDAAIDVGAYIGTHAIPMARAVGPAGQVLAFEPQPLARQLLRANLAANQIGNVRLEATLCGAARGWADIPAIDYHRPGNFGATAFEAGGQGAERVPIAPLDDVFDGERLRLVKVDAEGMEADVLRGAQRLLERLRPILYVENESLERSEDLLRLIAALGYAAYWHRAPLFSPTNARQADENVFGAAECVNLLCLPDSGDVAAAEGLARVAGFDEHPRRRRLAQAERLADKAAEALAAQAQRLLEQGRYSEALALAERALAMRPGSERALSLRAEALKRAGS